MPHAEVVKRRPEAVERRRVPRHEMVMNVRVASSVGVPMLSARLTEISTLGAEIELPTSMNAGQTLRLALRVPGRERALLIDGHVHRCAMRSVLWACGLEFVNVSAQDHADLALFLDLETSRTVRDQ